MTTSPTQVGILAEAATPTPRAAAPFGLVLGLVAGLAILATSLTQLRDIDLYWHLLAGAELAQGKLPWQLGLAWSFAPHPAAWTSTQWLAELLFHALHQAGGWAGLAAFRVVTAALAVAALAHSTLRGRPRALAGFPFLLATAIVAFVSQERPQQFTLIGASVLGGVLVAGLVGRDLPRWWILLPATSLWANLHGGWILVPFVLGLVAIGALVDSAFRSAGRAARLAALSVAAGCLTPSGVAGLTAALRFSRATDLIVEWEKVQPMADLGLVSVAMLALLLVGWSASRAVPAGEAISVVAILMFTWLAWRNLAPGTALLAPLAAHRLTMGFPRVRGHEPSWSAPVGIAAACLLTVAGVAVVAAKPNLPTTTEPIALARAVAHLDPGQRVLNDYNTSGIVLYFGGRGTRVAIDGRADRYGGEYIEDYVGLMALKGDWQALLAQLDPTSALIKDDCALAYLLEDVRGWTEAGADNGYVLLEAPGGAGAGRGD